MNILKFPPDISKQRVTVKQFCNAMTRYKQSQAFKKFCYQSSAERIKEWGERRKWR